MLQNSFIQLPGIGPIKERSLWKNGTLTWKDFINKKKINKQLKQNKSFSEIETCVSKLEKKDAIYFYKTLPSSEHWRIFKEFQSHCLYLDIETNGGDYSSGIITTIATYDGIKIKYYINGKNFNDFIKDIFHYKVLITYNGKLFDIPFIENFFNVELNHAQIDLRYILKSLGYVGGLKSCEKQLGLKRYGLEFIDGSMAIQLWYDYYYNSNLYALDTLLAYNIEDTINLEKLMRISFNIKIDKLGHKGFGKIPFSQSPTNLLKPHLETISRIKSKFGCRY